VVTAGATVVAIGVRAGSSVATVTPLRCRKASSNRRSNG